MGVGVEAQGGGELKGVGGFVVEIMGLRVA